MVFSGLPPQLLSSSETTPLERLRAHGFKRNVRAQILELVFINAKISSENGKPPETIGLRASDSSDIHALLERHLQEWNDSLLFNANLTVASANAAKFCSAFQVIRPFDRANAKTIVDFVRSEFLSLGIRLANADVIERYLNEGHSSVDLSMLTTLFSASLSFQDF